VPRLQRRPSFEVDEGENWFRSLTKHQDLSNLTLPHLAFGRALVEDTSFANSDLSQSLMNWTDYVRVSFARADLHDSDLRSSIFDDCDLTGATLDNCDLRCSTFDRCRFDGATLGGAVLTDSQRNTLPLSPDQRAAIVIDSADPAPGG
jgi:uncharacterized protein YjbI with pentapeptide repeats